jgi:hypothetical protein
LTSPKLSPNLDDDDDDNDSDEIGRERERAVNHHRFHMNEQMQTKAAAVVKMVVMVYVAFELKVFLD